MSALQAILFGGLELWTRGRRRRDFESQKTAAAFAYLLLNRGKRFSREHVAGLLWPDAEERAARANIRQALYNIRETMPRGRADDWILSDRGGVGISPVADIWVDCEEFEKLLGTSDSEPAASHALARAAGLYRGDLLSGLTIRDSEPYELWLLTQQERLRQAALDALRRLVAMYTQRGEYRLGIQYAARLVELDPLSESGHRALMRLYAFAGERSRAVTHYRQLVELLRGELGIASEDETRRLYEEIAADAGASRPLRAPVRRRPVVPLVGRRGALARLEECWRVVAAGATRFTMVEGEDGVGKTRLVRSFLGDLSVRARVEVVPGRFPSHWPQEPYEPLGAMIEQLLARAPGGREAARRQVSDAGRMALAVLVPMGPEGKTQRGSRADAGRLMAQGVADLLRWFVGGERTSSALLPVVMFLDDAENAGPATVRLLHDVVPLLGGLPVWFVATCNRALSATWAGGLDRCRAGTDPRYARLQLERLTATEIVEIARELVEERAVWTFSRVVAHASEGLPLAIVMLVNALWDEGVLQPAAGAARGWQVTNAQALTDMARLSVPELVLRRLAGLSPSVRRLATLAAVAVDGFDPQLLARAENELREVIEIGVDALIERWIIRQTPSQWASGGLQAGANLWRSGARSLRLDFDHQVVRRAILHSLHPRRRRVLHMLLGAALREQERVTAGALVHHHAGAGSWLEAAAAAAAAMEKALAVGADEDAGRTLRFARRLVRRASVERPDLRASGKWESVLKRLEAAEATFGLRTES